MPERKGIEPHEAPDQPDFDPRWEVQPETAGADDPGDSRRRTLITLVAIVVVAGLLGWFLLGSAPPF